MVKTQKHVITYSHPFGAVTSSLWSKYDRHKYVQNIEILDRHVDENGRLHSRRLLSMGGNLPAIFRPFVPVKLVHMLETAVVDPVAQTMTVETSNISCLSVLDARSRSRYSPSPYRCARNNAAWFSSLLKKNMFSARDKLCMRKRSETVFKLTPSTSVPSSLKLRSCVNTFSISA